jgi:hypothetical protein
MPKVYYYPFLADAEYLGTADRANTLSSRFAILEGYLFSILYFSFSTAFHTICLHLDHLLILSGYESGFLNLFSNYKRNVKVAAVTPVFLRVTEYFYWF